jgi:hypothetical protein
MASSALQGVPSATLQLWLREAQHALQRLMTGDQAVTVSYAEGEGNRSVTYTRTTVPNLRAWIGELQGALNPGVRTRSAIGVAYR